ncbi:hypothetical protein [Streptomyces rishiriensis]|uniref:hypothetical protein n=1 Tax=Streptomyces rishiriensis TaxID=68264 RepID=UPI0037CEC092
MTEARTCSASFFALAAPLSAPSVDSTLTTVVPAREAINVVRQVEPADRITFGGYGTAADYVTELRLC